VLYAGNVKPHKNLERLVQAFARVKARPGFDDLKLFLIGDDAGRFPSLRRAVEGLGVRQDVRFFGFVPDSTLAALYRMASVFAFPSLYEGFGLPPLEAMASGTPVITSNVSSLPEVVGDAGIQVDPHDVDGLRDAIRLLSEDDERWEALRSAGLARAAQFSWERCARETLAVYRKVLA
jgi:glycosyltransferase involved in cell wall biosynthesis